MSEEQGVFFIILGAVIFALLITGALQITLHF